MNKKDIFNKVGTIINELNDQYDYLSQSPDNLNELELELFSAHANFLSDHIAVLIKLCDNSLKPEDPKSAASSEIEKDTKAPAASLEERPDVQPVIAEEKEAEEEPAAWVFEMEDEPDPAVHSAEEQAAAHLSPVEDEPVLEKKEDDMTTEPVKNTEPLFNAQDSSAESDPDEEYVVRESIISEKTVHIPVEETPKKEQVPTLNDLLSRSSAQRNAGNQFSARQVKDLKSMINMNDKLLFVRDLFNGYSLAYSEAIELLNRFDNLDSADNFLKQNYAAKNNWAAKQEVADRFYEILSQRFSK